MPAKKGNKYAKGNKGGRKTRYRPEYAEQARKLCLLGYTDKQLADFFQVTEQTINNWKKRHKVFFESLKAGKDLADCDIVQALYNKAKGIVVNQDIEVNGEKLTLSKEYPPDTNAIKFWLINRQPEKWRNRIETKHEIPKLNIPITDWIDVDTDK